MNGGEEARASVSSVKCMHLVRVHCSFNDVMDTREPQSRPEKAIEIERA